MAPYQQGDLDGLCGVYSVINAVHHLCPELKRPAFQHLFRLLLKCLSHKGRIHEDILWAGLERKTVHGLARMALAIVEEQYGIALTATRLAKPLRKGADGTALIAHLDGQLSSTTVAILGLGGCMNHWSVAIATTPANIRLADSHRLSRITRRRCIRPDERQVYLKPTEILFITREDMASARSTSNG